LVYAVLACLAIMRAGQPGPPSDVWWQMSTGRYIVEHGALPTEDIFTYTCAGHPWVVHEWAWEIVMFTLYQAWGYAGLMALRVAVFLPAVLMVTWLCFQRGGRELPVLATVLVGVLAVSPVINDRPQMTGMLFLTALLLLIEQARRGRPRWLWLAPVVILLWTNIHGSYIMGLGLLFLHLVSLVPQWQRQRRAGKALSPVPQLVIGVFLVAGAAVLLNPHGLDGALYPLRYAFGDLSYHSTLITEYGPPQFGGMDRFLLVLLLLLVLSLGLSRQRLRLFEALTLAVFLYFVLRWGRNVGMSAFMMMPILAEQLTAATGRPEPARSPQGNTPTWLYAAVIAVMLAMTGISLRASLAKTGQVFADYTPEAAVRFIQDNRLQGSMFNSYEWGGYLGWRLWPEYRVYIDGRGDVMGREFMEEYVSITTLRPGWRETLDKHGVAWAILKPGALLGRALRLDPAFALLRATPEFECFVRTPGPNEALLRRPKPDPPGPRQEPEPRPRNL
jgi:hypothetical protein